MHLILWLFHLIKAVIASWSAKEDILLPTLQLEMHPKAVTIIVSVTYQIWKFLQGQLLQFSIKYGFLVVWFYYAWGRPKKPEWSKNAPKINQTILCSIRNLHHLKWATILLTVYESIGPGMFFVLIVRFYVYVMVIKLREKDNLGISCLEMQTVCNWQNISFSTYSISSRDVRHLYILIRHNWTIHHSNVFVFHAMQSKDN